jgi:hypothetical protein
MVDDFALQPLLYCLELYALTGVYNLTFAAAHAVTCKTFTTMHSEIAHAAILFFDQRILSCRI